jgi:hypothetical protein
MRVRAVLFVLTLIAATLTLVAASPSGAAHFVSVTPNTGLHDGQVVQVTVAESGLLVTQCLATFPLDGNLSDCAGLLASGSTTGTPYTLSQNLLTSHGLIDCGAAPGTCVIAAGAPEDLNNPSNIGTAPLSFAAPAPAAWVVQPTSDLIEGSTVRVAARGFAANQAAVVQQCAIDTAPSHCDPRVLNASTDAAGSLDVQFTVHRSLTTPSGAFDCGVVTCLITAPVAIPLTVPLQFPISTTVVHVTPNTGLVEGQTVSVEVSGLSAVNVGVAECQAGATGINDCDLGTAIFPGGFPTTFVVHRFITIGSNTTIDCAAAPGACIIGAADIGDINATIGTAPIAFAPPSPTRIPDCFKGGWQHFTDGAGQPFKNQGQCVSFAARHMAH